MSNIIMSGEEAWKRATELCQSFYAGDPPIELLTSIAKALIRAQDEASEATATAIGQRLGVALKRKEAA